MSTLKGAGFVVGLATVIVLSGWVANAQLIKGPKDCLPVLAKDYYSYAEENKLQTDFLKSIDAESWRELKTSNNLNIIGVFSAGLFSLSDDYSTFSAKRDKYLETVHYNRSQQQALK